MKFFYIAMFIISMIIGAYAWKVLSTGRNPTRDIALNYEQRIAAAHGTMVYIGDVEVGIEELDWEFSLHTKGILKSEDMTPFPDIGDRLEIELSSLKQRLLATIIERKLLFQFVEKDQNFEIRDPSRYTDCLEEWQKSLEESPDFFTDSHHQEWLKNRLCEKSIVNQYLAERIFNQIVVTDKEVEAYYLEHKQSFVDPERVLIRNLVSSSEKEAKQIRSKLRRSNFAEMAQQESITPEAERGGLLGPFARGEMPSVFDVAFHMRPGEIRGVLKSAYGFHLIMLERKDDRHELSLEEARPRVLEILQNEKQEHEYRKWLELALNSIEVRPPRPSF